MARPYGQYPKYARRAGSPEPAKNLRVKLHGRQDLEQMSLLLQKIIARLHEHGVHSVENCSLYLVPLGQDDSRLQLKDSHGKALNVLEISLPISERFIKATRGS